MSITKRCCFVNCFGIAFGDEVVIIIFIIVSMLLGVFPFYLSFFVWLMKKTFDRLIQQSRKAFTLIEILIVIAIIGILTVALLPRIQGAQSSARNTARKADLNQIATALAAYNGDAGRYPENLDELA